jgi:hypothetical protein
MQNSAARFGIAFWQGKRGCHCVGFVVIGQEARILAELWLLLDFLEICNGFLIWWQIIHWQKTESLRICSCSCGYTLGGLIVAVAIVQPRGLFLCLCVCITSVNSYRYIYKVLLCCWSFLRVLSFGTYHSPAV